MESSRSEIEQRQELGERYGQLIGLLDVRISVRDVAGVSFHEACAYRTQLCDDIHGALPYGLFAVPQGIVFGAAGTLLSSPTQLLKEQNFGSLDDKDVLRNLCSVSVNIPAPDTNRHVPHLLSLVSPCCYCFWHWVMDSLPKVLLAEATGYTGSYLLPPPVMTPWARVSMELLGIPSSRLEEHSTNIVLTDFLYIPTYFSGFHAYKNFPLLEKLRVCLRDAVKDSPVTSSPQRLFIPRKPNATFRKIINFDQVKALLGQFRFEAVFFEDFSFTDQLRIASQADAIVAPHGSGMTHTLFMNEGSTVVELFPFQRRDSCPCYEVLMPISKHRYHSIEAQTDLGSDIEVDTDILEQILLKEFS